MVYFCQTTLILSVKLAFSFEKQVEYQIKFYPLVTVRQKNTEMIRIKEVLEAKGISQTELVNRPGKTFNMVNLLFLYCIRLHTSWMLTFSNFLYQINNLRITDNFKTT